MARKPQRVFGFISAAVLLLVLEFCLRGYFAHEYERSDIMLRPAAVLDVLHPGIDSALATEVTPNNGVVDVLLLGGSVLHSEWGTIGPTLQTRLETEYKAPVRLHNLGTPAHTSLDSKLKLELLQDKAYDAILLYHGINETVFNNCPAHVFKSDYSHVEFYRSLYSTTGTFSNISILPHTIAVLQLAWIKAFSKEQLVPFHIPENKAWQDFGKTLRTDTTFAANYTAVMENAHKRGIPVVVPSFATYVPDNYSMEAFMAKELDYTDPQCVTEVWGTPKYIEAAIAAHNVALAEICEQQSENSLLYCVELDEQFPKHGKNFNDICHLTPAGCNDYVRIVAPAIITALDEHSTFEKR